MKPALVAVTGGARRGSAAGWNRKVRNGSEADCQERTIVVSKGRAYVVDVDRKLASEISWPVNYVEYAYVQRLVVVGNGLWLDGIGTSGVAWRTRRISWDGMRYLSLNGSKIIGEAYTPLGPPDWLPFEVTLASGDVEGGSYNGPD